MDLRQLEIIRAIADTGSFTRAGARLHLSQSAVSRQVLLLEDEMNEPLFIRFGRRVQLTPAGEAILQLSGRLFADIAETRAAIVDQQERLTGSVRVVGGMTVCLYVLPRLLGEFQRHHPDVELKIATGGTQRNLRRLKTGSADLALLTLPFDEPGVTTIPVLREELLLIMRPDHRLARAQQPIDPSALAHEDFVVFEPGSNTRRVVDQFFHGQRILPRFVGETENVEIMKAMVANGLGISFVPFLAVAREAAAGTLAYARVQGADLVRETGWVYRTTPRVPRPVREMMATLEHVVHELPLSPEEAMEGAAVPRRRLAV